MFRLILSLFLIALTAFLPGKAGFFDDLFGGDGETKDRGPFFIRVRDNLDNKETISTQTRKFVLSVFYLRDFFQIIDDTDRAELKEALNDAISVKVQFEKNGDKETFGDEDFKFKVRSVKDDNDDGTYNEIVYESTEFTITRSQKVFFKFDVEEFADEVDVSIQEPEDDFSEKTINFRPIVIEPKGFGLEEDLTRTANLDEAFNPQSITGSFSTGKSINTDIQSTDFDLSRNGKDIKAQAKLKSKKFNLDLELSEELEGNNDFEYLRDLGNGDYEINAPIRIKASKTNQTSKFTNAKKFKLKVPLQIETQTDDGLELKIKILAKDKLNSL